MICYRTGKPCPYEQIYLSFECRQSNSQTIYCMILSHIYIQTQIVNRRLDNKDETNKGYSSDNAFTDNDITY